MSEAFPGSAIHAVMAERQPVVIAATATAVPQHVLSRKLVEAQIGSVFSLSGRRLEAVLEIVANSRIERRYSIFPVDYLIEPRPLERISREYRDYSLCLGRRAAQEALDRAGIAAQEVDAIITVSCTGFMIPSLDAYLAPELGLRANVRRLPVTELGCAAGAAGLALARDYVELARLEHAPAPARLQEWKDGLNWFFSRGREASSAALRGAPPLARSDLGRTDWEQRLVARLRLKGVAWRTEQTYRGWAWRLARFMGPRPMTAATGAEARAFLTKLAVEELLYEGFSDSKYRPCPLLEKMVAAGRLGRKTGRGFYEYPEGGKKG